jgi:lysophospholipase L1-like esterase
MKKKEMAAKTSYLHYIDVASHLVSADGSIRSDLFRRDQLHLNAEGYEIWNREIRRALFVGISPNLLEGGPYEK